MAGMNNKKIHRYRMDGMAYALRVVEMSGIEGLREEIRTRGAYFIPLEVTRDATHDLNAFLADRILETFKATVMFTLNQEFKFGRDRLLRFFEAFGKNCDMVTALDPFGSNYEKISDYAKYLKDRYDIEFDLDKIERIEMENESDRKKMLEYDYTLQFLREHGFEDAAECLRQYAE